MRRRSHHQKRAKRSLHRPERAPPRVEAGRNVNLPPHLLAYLLQNHLPPLNKIQPALHLRSHPIHTDSTRRSYKSYPSSCSKKNVASLILTHRNASKKATLLTFSSTLAPLHPHHLVALLNQPQQAHQQLKMPSQHSSPARVQHLQNLNQLLSRKMMEILRKPHLYSFLPIDHQEG